MEQIKRLQTQKSKLIILGRPSIFLSEEEQTFALQDKFKIGENWIKETAFQGFSEINLDYFDEEQIGIFIKKYVGYLKESGQIKKKTHSDIINRIAESDAKSLFDLAKRPFQLKMIADILPEWNEPINDLTKVLLYEHFTDRIILREAKKNARSKISLSERKMFSADLAWHMWNVTYKDNISSDDVPDNLISNVNTNIKSKQALKRELLVGCSLEFKPPDLLYFPHRSIQEYLVSIKLISKTSDGSTTVSSLDSQSEEVFDFYKNSITYKDLKGIVQTLLKHRGKLSQRMEKLFTNNTNLMSHLESFLKPGIESPWPGLLLKNRIAFKIFLTLNNEFYLHLGFYELFHKYFWFEKSKSKFELNPINLINELNSIIELPEFRKKAPKPTATLRYLITQFSFRKKDKTVFLVLGNLRKHFTEYFISTSYLESMYGNNKKLNLDSDFERELIVTSNLEKFKKILLKIKEGRY